MRDDLFGRDKFFGQLRAISRKNGTSGAYLDFFISFIGEHQVFRVSSWRSG
jgi:hypothetical protein